MVKHLDVGMPAYLQLPIWCFVILQVYAIWRLFDYGEQLNLQTSNQGVGIMNYLSDNLLDAPIKNIAFSDSCADGYEQLALGQWAGLRGGCYCTKGVKFKAAKCNKVDLDNGCRAVHAQPRLSYTNWRNKKICVQRQTTYSKTLTNCSSGATVCCPDGYKQCTEDLCVPSADLCPITSVTIQRSSNIGGPSTPTASDGVSNNKTTSATQRIVRRHIQRRAKLQRAKVASRQTKPDTQPAPQKNETVKIDDQNMVTIGRTNKYRQIVEFEISRSLIPCLDPHLVDDGTTNVTYPLLDPDVVQATCGYYGFNNQYSLTADYQPENVTLKENGIYPGIDAPEYNVFLVNSTSFLVSRAAIRILQTDKCADFTPNFLVQFQDKLDNLDRTLYTIEIIQSVLLGLILIAVLATYSSATLHEKCTAKFGPIIYLILGIVAVIIMVLFVCARQWICASYFQDLKNSEQLLGFFIKGKCIAEYRYNEILAKISIGDVYQKIEDLNETVILLSIIFGALIIIMAIVAYKHYMTYLAMMGGVSVQPYARQVDEPAPVYNDAARVGGGGGLPSNLYDESGKRRVLQSPSNNPPTQTAPQPQPAPQWANVAFVDQTPNNPTSVPIVQPVPANPATQTGSVTVYKPVAGKGFF